MARMVDLGKGYDEAKTRDAAQTMRWQTVMGSIVGCANHWYDVRAALFMKQALSQPIDWPQAMLDLGEAESRLMAVIKASRSETPTE